MYVNLTISNSLIIVKSECLMKNSTKNDKKHLVDIFRMFVNITKIVVNNFCV